MVDTNSIAMMDPNSRRRVKLYMLNAERMWDDRGTGYISSMYVEKFRGMCLLVRSEDDGSVLMESKINLHTAYQKQQDTLIVWSEQANDFALSFQEKAGCDEIWEKICQEQGCNPSVNITKDVPIEGSERGDEPKMDDDPSMDEIPDASQLAASTPIPLPTCELSKLEEIQEFISNYVMLPVHTERLAISIENERYIKKLLDLFHVCEDLEHKDGLAHLYEIFSNILKLNKNALYEIMFAEDTIFDLIGVLEYNPNNSSPRIKHREFLRTQANFKEVIPLNNSELVQRIHQLYRIQYIQDVILPTPTVFEETMLSTLTSYIFFMKAEIVTQIQEDKHFLQTLFAQILDDEVDEEKQRDLVLFLKEFCVFSQSLQPNCKELFFKTLINYGVLGALEIVLGLDDAMMKSAALDIFSFVLECNPSNVREFIMQEAAQSEDEDLLINLVLEQMISDVDPELGGAVQLMGIIRLLVDPENMLGTTNKTEKSEFLNFFYKHSMHVLTAPLFANTVDPVPSKDDYQTAQLLSIILELLTFCIERHGYHVRNFVLSKDLIRRVLVLLRSRHAFLALAALRLVRRVIGLKDEFYNRYITKGDLFAPIVAAFLSNGDKYNLLNSAMIELFDFIRVDDNKTLISYVVENHYKEFEGVDYVQTFKQLKKKYDDLVNGGSDKPTLDRWVYSNSTPSLMRNTRLRRDARSLEEEEEMWFDNDDDFEESDTIMPMSEMLKSRDSSDYESFDKINKYLERNRHLNKYEKENDSMKASPPRIGGMGGGSINININNRNSPTPPDSPEAAGAPVTSPAASPVSSAQPAPVSPLSDRSNSPSPPASSAAAAAAASPSTTPTTATTAPSATATQSPATSTTCSTTTTVTVPGSTSSSSSSSSTSSSPSSSPPNSPAAAPGNAAAAAAVTTKKPGLVGLVDYPDEDSEEEDEDSDSGLPSPKRQRLSSNT